MVKLVLTILLIYSVTNSSITNSSVQSNIDVLHYRFHISLSDKNDSIFGVSIIRFVVKEKKPTIEFDLTNVKKDGKGMLTTIVGYKIDYAGIEKFKHENDKLLIPSKLNKGDTAEVIINYKGIPADGLIISKNQFGKRTFFADNWPNRAHNWIPCIDDPADKATVEFIVVAPSHYQVISNGIQVEESSLPENIKETHYREDVPLPTKVMAIGVADFAVSLVGDINCVPVYSWVYPENKTNGFKDYSLAKGILAWHINYIGPYPYKKLANVQSKTRFGGMENAGAIFYAEDLVNGLGDQEELLSHEIVHQWFGDMATEKSFAHLWLSEGFATYLTHMYIESKYGTDSMNAEMRMDREMVIDFVKNRQRPVVDSTSDYMKLLGPNSYQKGSWVLHMLRRQLGDSAFKKVIRQYYATYAGKNADTKDLQKVFESVSGKDLNQFFKQWLFTPENPQLGITWKYLEKGKQLTVTVKQLQKNIFDIPLQIAIPVGNGKPQIKTLQISRTIETFNIPVGRKPYLSANSLDPFTSLLYEASIKEEK
jgi:aminopeptidase N